MKEDVGEFRRARQNLFAWVAQQQADGLADAQLTPPIVRDEELFREVFDEAYTDYLCWRNDVSALEHPSNRGQGGDIDSAMSDVTEMVLSVTDDRPAGTAIRLALIHIESEQIIDTDDPFPVEAHAPLVVELDGGIRLVHDHLMRRLCELV